MAPRLAIEASELRGKSFACQPGCGFCCLCEPGLDAMERARFTGPLAKAVTSGGDALRVVGQAGPCALLSADRACTQYELRPRGCRSFPYHTTMGWRVQVNLNRGCPGTWVAGAPAASRSFDPAQALPPGPEALAAAQSARAAWATFRSQARGAGVYEAPSAVRKRLLACLPLLRDEAGLAAGLALAEAGLPVTAANLRRGRGAPVETLHCFLLDQARATFGQRDAKRLPMFVDGDDAFRWRAFRLRGGALQRCEILPNGALRADRDVPLEVVLLPREPAAQALFDAHAATLVDRDLLYGLAAFMLDRLGYGEPFASAALRELCAALGDLWLRASFLARFEGAEVLDARAMTRGVAFFDMDFLNAPTLGVAF